MAPLDRLRSAAPPWVTLWVLEDERSLDAVDRALPGFLVRRIDGRKCRTKAGLLTQLARALEFPAYFGKNWDALEECLTDLEWLPAPGYLIVVTDAEDLLAGDERDYATFVAIMDSVGRERASVEPGQPSPPAAPFHVVLTVRRGNEAKRASWRIPRLNA